MRLRFFTIPIHDSGVAAEEVNRFLAAHRIVAIDQQFVSAGSASAWAVCIRYEEGPDAASADGVRKGGKVDYREVLSNEEFTAFARLRTLRKNLAEQEGVPPYALFTNEQLAAMVQRRVTSAAGLQAIDGVGPARIAKYGARFLEALRAGPANAVEDGGAAPQSTATG